MNSRRTQPGPSFNGRLKLSRNPPRSLTPEPSSPPPLPTPPRPKPIKPVPSFQSFSEPVDLPPTPRSMEMNIPHRPLEVDPLDELCHHMNVDSVFLEARSPLPPSMDVPVRHDAHMPTHLLAAYTSSGSSGRRVMIPVRRDHFTILFRVDILPPRSRGVTSPVPFLRNGQQFVTLPVVPFPVPNAATVPLLFLFALGFRDTEQMASYLLPSNVVEEFPFSATMAAVLSRCPDDELNKHIIQNHALWMNVLALGPRDKEVGEMVQTAWAVTAEALRIRKQRV